MIDAMDDPRDGGMTAASELWLEAERCYWQRVWSGRSDCD